MAFPWSSAPDGSDRGNEGGVQLQDIKWLFSLSEPELDFLISLKELAIRRAKNAGYKDIGDKFDLRMLRALGFILLEFFKERMQKTCESESIEILASLNQCALSFLNIEGKCDSSAEAIDDASSLVTPRRKRMWDGLCEETTKCHKRKKTEDIDK